MMSLPLELFNGCRVVELVPACAERIHITLKHCKFFRFQLVCLSSVLFEDLRVQTRYQ